MAWGTLAKTGQQGEAPMRPSFVQRLTLVGDDDYATGGTSIKADLEAKAALARPVKLVDVWGPGLDSSDDITHLARYDADADLLVVHVLATGAEAANAADLSGVTFHLTAMYQ
jgi:hypothetical protein